ncbi:hypothetical protein BOTBODRAFT_290130 [Botryobasidium botryosum FD-172 SS1]|uniref:F-box domain-containing protein n=1 Tax=Botryobasidium botryosum (strain FD-172 SS1) TaxID=930990 RepID=A0A067MIM6_BOTB1|nr:hypothetical protein BOTBODRAFT_290130 [Botryobasidium botryosum FD-172 SS1]
MPITRTQSGKLPPPPVIDVDADSDSSLTELESINGIDSDIGISGGSDLDDPLSFIGARGKPPAKRARKGIGSASKGPQKTVRKRGGKLSQLPLMPLDILYEVFGHVGPAELISLSRANKPFRRILMSKRSMKLWQDAIEDAGVPECPTDLSEPAWANLIFGGLQCQSCGIKGVAKIDFYLRRRLCNSCKKRSLLYSVKFKSRFPDFDPTIMELIPYTNTGGWAHGHASNSKFFWISDIYEMSQMLGVYQSDVHMRKPGAKKALDDFQASRMEHVAAIIISAHRFVTWHNDAGNERIGTARQAKQERKDAIIARFVGLGYHRDDAKQVVDRDEGRSDRLLTEKIWARVRQQLEPALEELKAKRRVREREDLVRARQQSLRTLYKDFKKRLVPSQWANLPSDADLLQFAESKHLVNLETDDPLSESDLASLMEELPALTSSWIERRRDEVSRKIPGGAPNTGFGGPSNDVDGAVDPESLEAATSIFVCGTERCDVRSLTFSHNGREPLVGLSHALSHVCFRPTYYHWGGQREIDPTYTSQLIFSDRGFTAMSSLLEALGLGSKRVMRAYLDREDPRLVCMACKRKPMNGGTGRMAWSWIECISHYLSVERSHGVPKWRQLTPEQTRHVKQQEGLGQFLEDRELWTCNHCSAHFENLKTKQQVIDHVKQVHEIPRPSEGTDFFIDPRAKRPPAQRVMVLMQDPHPPPAHHVPYTPTGQLPPKYSNYICKQCPTSSTRRFGGRGIADHLRAKHGITDPGPEHFGK